MTCHGRVYQLFLYNYATHKENKSDKQDTVFHSVYKEGIVYLFYPTL